jgi:isopentenyl phosphate kinase
MRAHVFHGVKLSLMAEDSNKAIPHTEFTPLTFGDVVYTGKSNHA